MTAVSAAPAAAPAQPASSPLFDFPALKVGSHFDPDPGTGMKLPIPGVGKIPWMFKADMTEVSPDRVRWHEYDKKFGMTASGDVVIERTGADQARLSVDWMMNGKRIMPTLTQDYRIVSAKSNHVVLTNLDDPTKQSIVAMPSPDRVDFKMHLPLGLRIHKLGKVTNPSQ